jgi:DNA-binding transcriptional regulator of glucitol operon
VPGLRVFLTPRWLALHVVALALAVTMVLLGRWQLDVSNAKHFNLQNFGYALQWWAFSAFALVMWARIIRDHGRRGTRTPATSEPPGWPGAEPGPNAEPPVAYRRYVMPESASAPAIATDPEHAAYNDYLAQLAADQAAKSRAEGTAP